MSKARYYVTTWDSEKQMFTPQCGVRTGPYKLFALRRALRALRRIGYEGRKGDPAVLVEVRSETSTKNKKEKV